MWFLNACSLFDASLYLFSFIYFYEVINMDECELIAFISTLACSISKCYPLTISPLWQQFLLSLGYTCYYCYKREMNDQLRNKDDKVFRQAITYPFMLDSLNTQEQVICNCECHMSNLYF